MRIVIVATHWPGAPARLLARGFQQAGHDVHTCGPYVHGDWRPTADFIIPADIDLIVTADHKIYWKVPTKIPHVLVAQDVASYNKDMYTFRDAIHFDHEFYVDSRDCEGRPNAHFLPCAYDPTIHKPGPPWEQRAIPVALYGQLDGGRQKLVDAVSKVSPVATGYVDFGDYALAYQNTKISLCHSRCKNLDQRVFETMAMGCLVISDFKRDAFQVGLFQGKHHVVYYNLREAQGYVEVLLREPVLAESIIADGMEWVRPHTWKARAEEIIKITFGG